MPDAEKVVRLWWAGCLAFLMWCEIAQAVLADETPEDIGV